MTIKVLIVDDSAVVRQVLSSQLAGVAGIEVMGSASDPLFAMKKMEDQWPDVIILDIEMPRMDGITFLKKIMAERPTPVVICSTLTEKGAEVTMQAMSAGAVDIIQKPKAGLKGFLQDQKTMLIDDSVSAIGTANFDNRSFRLNFEITAIIVDRAFNTEVEAMFLEDFENSRKMDQGELARKPFWFKLAVNLARLTSPVL